jgi:hypothetical protein
MGDHCLAVRLLAQEARSLLTRLGRVKPFAISMPMVAAASISPRAQVAIESHLIAGRRRLQEMVWNYVNWLESPAGCAAGAAEAQRRYAILKLRFNAVIADFDIFADVLSQRSEHETGVWVAGLDELAEDALRLPGDFYQTPPVVCYLDRSHGAAIRRARTKLPAGGRNPCAVIRVPRERMVGSGIAASVIHEAAHQGSALLGLVPSLRNAIEEIRLRDQERDALWLLWSRWISEIICDFWAVAKLGIAATLGLMSVVSLPRVFVFRPNLDDPHPMSWLRVKLSCAMGDTLYPHPQWRKLADLWDQYYPSADLPIQTREFLAAMQASIPRLAALLTEHRPESLRGISLREALADSACHPSQLSNRFEEWQQQVTEMQEAPPTLVFGVIGQAKAEGRVDPEQEGQLLAALLSRWALRRTLTTASACAGRWAVAPKRNRQLN